LLSRRGCWNLAAAASRTVEEQRPLSGLAQHATAVQVSKVPEAGSGVKELKTLEPLQMRRVSLDVAEADGPTPSVKKTNLT
jgi:hypothetical protein